MNTYTEFNRVNARRDDVFDVFNCRHYEGPNPYLNVPAFVFDLAETGYHPPLPLESYLSVIGDRYPVLQNETYASLAHLFARAVSEVNKLDIDLHFDRWSLTPCEGFNRIAIEGIHSRTTRAVAYCVWDWFEAITQSQSFNLNDQIEVLQGLFRQSVFGGPTIYALLRTAHQIGVPTFYLWDEGLMQYGYGQHQIRGVATTFHTDSHLDSDFTTRKDDCKVFLETLGFPVPKGEVVISLREALIIADRIGYPVAVKPVSGHKGIGVTANIQDEDELEAAYDRAIQSIPPEERIRIIVEKSIAGKDYRLLCVHGRFVAATERQPASVIGDGESTIAELIDRENRSSHRVDTPTSALGKIKIDDAMHHFLEQQGLFLDNVVERDRKIYLRKVANLSSGGLSIDATPTVHPDNIILAQDVAQHFQLACLGIDVIAGDLAESWKEGNFSIIEINAAPGIYMHLKPAVGNSVDVPAAILNTFFESVTAARIPIITFNRISVSDMQELIDHILLHKPNWVIGAVCREAVFINRAEKSRHPNYNTNVMNLLRNPRLTLLIAEYTEDLLEKAGTFYSGSDVVILDHPTDTEKILTRDVFSDSTVVIRQHDTISIQRQGLIEQYQLSTDEPIKRVFLKEIATLL